jgi:NAD(P)-dependent dehydrogenase (short-subunit alcohol dehydrogenase family)
LRLGRAPRVVTLSSGMAYIGRIDAQDLQSANSYSRTRAYANSKLANLLFMNELGRRAPWLISVAAHPGATRTNLQQHTGFGTAIAMKLIGQEADRGALPTLYAAAGAAATGEFYGPRYLMNMQGPPVEVRQPGRAHDEAVARALWDESETLTGVRYAFDAPAPPAAPDRERPSPHAP